MITRIPPSLKKGDTIGVFSSSAPGTAWIPARTELAIRYLEAQGFRVRLGTLAGKGAGSWRSGTIRERAEELNALIHDPEVKCLMASAGGLTSNAILSWIDYRALRRQPKLIVGHSDITVILAAVYAQTGLLTCYGPHLISNFGEVQPYADATLKALLDVIGEGAQVPHVFPTPNQWTEDSVGLEESGGACTAHPNALVTVRGGSASGRLLGGCLDALLGVFATPFMPQLREGDILFLEDVRKTPEELERSFALLDNADVFRRIGGLILGKHADFRDQGTGMKPWEAPMELLERYRFPILAEFDCGHTKPMLTLPLGASVRLDADQKRVTLLERITR